MNSDAMLYWLEEEWMNLPVVQRNETKEIGRDIEDAAPWNKGRI